MDGVVTQMALVTGQRTTDTAAVTLADISSGMRYTAQISEEEGKYVAVGDTVTAGQKIGQAKEGALSLPVHASIDGVVMDVNEKTVTIKAREK